MGAKIQRNIYLLMALVYINIGVCSLRHFALHGLFGNHEASFQYRRVVLVFIYYSDRIVATDFRTTPVVW